MISFLRGEHNLRVQVYVDDFILCADKSAITDHRDTLVDTLTQVGWIINVEKSVLTPRQTITFIGFTIDTVTSGAFPTLWVARARVLKLRGALRRTIKAQTCNARALARILGQCISMSLAISYGKIMLRGAYNVLRSRTSWEDMLTLTRDAISDLTWWLNEMKGERKKVLENVQLQG